MQSIWVAVTAHRPLDRLNALLKTISHYDSFPYKVTVCVYIDYDSQDSLEFLEKAVGIFSNIDVQVKVASPGYEGWFLTWAHKTPMILFHLDWRIVPSSLRASLTTSQLCTRPL